MPGPVFQSWVRIRESGTGTAAAGVMPGGAGKETGRCAHLLPHHTCPLWQCPGRVTQQPILWETLEGAPRGQELPWAQPQG